MGNRHHPRRARGTDPVPVAPNEIEEEEYGDRPGHRLERLTHILKEELSAVLREEIADPALADVRFASVELSVDYRHVRIGWLILRADRESRRRAADALARAAGFFAARVEEKVDMKRVPQIRFACLGDATDAIH